MKLNASFIALLSVFLTFANAFPTFSLWHNPKCPDLSCLPGFAAAVRNNAPGSCRNTIPGDFNVTEFVYGIRKCVDSGSEFAGCVVEGMELDKSCVDYFTNLCSGDNQPTAPSSDTEEDKPSATPSPTVVTKQVTKTVTEECSSEKDECPYAATSTPCSASSSSQPTSTDKSSSDRQETPSSSVESSTDSTPYSASSSSQAKPTVESSSAQTVRPPVCVWCVPAQPTDAGNNTDAGASSEFSSSTPAESVLAQPTDARNSTDTFAVAGNGTFSTTSGPADPTSTVVTYNGAGSSIVAPLSGLLPACMAAVLLSMA